MLLRAKAKTPNDCFKTVNTICNLDSKIVTKHFIAPFSRYTGEQKTTIEALKHFRITSVIRSTGGYDPCFLFQGTLATFKGNCLPAHSSKSLFTTERSDTGTYSSLHTPRFSPDQPLTLYISYEQPSPQIKRARHDIAPYRYSLRDDVDDSLIACSRGLATEILFDTTLNMAVWGTEMALSFPSLKEMQHFATCLRKVAIKTTSLASHPCAAFSTSRPLTPPGMMTVKYITPEPSLLTATNSLTGAPEDAASDADSPPLEEEK